MDWSRHPIAYFVAGMLVPISYIFVARRRDDNDDDDESYDDESDNDHVDHAWGLRDAPYKMVLCVNTSLGMGKGTLDNVHKNQCFSFTERIPMMVPNGGFHTLCRIAFVHHDTSQFFSNHTLNIPGTNNLSILFDIMNSRA